MIYRPGRLAGWALALIAGMATLNGVERIERGALRIEGIPGIPDEVAARTAQYANVRSAGFLGWHPRNSGILITTRFGETHQLHTVERPGGARHQVTFRDEPVFRGTFPPAEQYNGLVFEADVGGGEFYQYFWLDRENGESVLMTDGSSRNAFFTWSNGGDAFAYSSTRRNGRDFDIYLGNLDAPTRSRLILEREGYWMPLDWSPDDTRMLLREYRSVTDSSLAIMDLESGRVDPLNPRPVGAATVGYGDAAWTAEGDGIFLISDEDSEFLRLRHLDLVTGSSTILTPDIEWDVESLAISKDRRRLAFAVNAGGQSALYLLDTITGKRRKVDALPVGVVGRPMFSPDGSQVGFTLNTPRTPGDIFSLDFETGELNRWTFSEVGGLNPAGFVVPELVEYPTFDENEAGERRRIPAWVYRPNDASAEVPAPVVVVIHGGPEGQSRAVFSETVQLFAGELGAAVVVPNVRGSSGYGTTYLGLDNGMLREDSVRDIGTLLDWIETQPDLDPERVVVYGGSYGGYMVLASMVHFNDRLAGGIDVVGISNFVTFLENTQEYRRDLRRAEYGDERDPEMRAFLERISPLNHVQEIRKPMLVVQGYNDPRVPVGEAEQIVAALRNNGGDPWYLLAMNEGHGFRRKENRDYLRNAIVLFLQKVFQQ